MDFSLLGLNLFFVLASRGFLDGTTALVVAVVGNRIYCANVGDCRAVLIRYSLNGRGLEEEFCF